MKEPISNAKFLCRSCSEKLYPEGRWADKDLSWFVGKFVKLGFETLNYDTLPEDVKKEVPKNRWPNKEHLWVKVNDFGTGNGNDKEPFLRGTIDNVPIFVDWKYGQTVIFEAQEVEDVS